MKSRLNKLQSRSKDFWFGAALAVLFSFSFYPAINASVGTSTIQLSFAVIAFAGLAFAASLRLVRDQHIAMQLREKLLYGALLFIGLQLLVQGQGARGVLIAGLWASITVVLSLRLQRRVISGLIFGFIATSILLTVLAGGQVFLEAIGFRAGLPIAYVGDVFGFARATLFFEEPQFLASYVLIGLFLSTSLPPKYRYYVFGILTFGLALTLSRGAALGALLGFSALWIINYKEYTQMLRLTTASAAGLLAGIAFISFAGYVRQDGNLSPLYFSEVYVRQMAGLEIDRSDKIGLVSVRHNELEEHSIAAMEYEFMPQQSSQAPSSADSRFIAAEQALRDATDTPQTFVFGRGPGSYNAFTAERIGQSGGNGYTVNNVYVELLFEFGIAAVVALVTLIASLCARLYKLRAPIATAIMLAIIAVSVQQLFFGSLVNNLHFWVLITLALSVCSKAQNTNVGVATRKSRA